MGAAITHLGNYWFWRRQQEYEAHQLARGIRGEIGGLLDLLEKRNYQSALRSRAKDSQQIGQLRSFSVSVTREFFKVYEANVERIGTLKGDLPEHIARLYVLGEGVIENFNSLRNSEIEAELARLGVSEHPQVQQKAIKAWANQLEGAAALIDEMMRLGRKVRGEIERLYSGGPLSSVEDRFIERMRSRLPGGD